MQRIILDTDPGIDDAMALFLALSSPEVQIEAITTVAGNVGVDATTRNALALLERARRTDIPVARGSARPLVRSLIDASHVHSDNGIGNVVLPLSTVPPGDIQAIKRIIEIVQQAPGEITIVAIGPLTNIALALRSQPEIAHIVREVVIMGGALRVPGNVTPSAEFNIYADPHAAHIVLHAGWPIRLVSLDATMMVAIKREQFEAFTRGGGEVKTTIGQMVAFYFDVYAPQWGTDAFHMHDPLCLATVFQPDLIEWEELYVDVELDGTLTLGETVAYRRHNSPPNVRASISADGSRFMDLFMKRIDATFP